MATREPSSNSKQTARRSERVEWTPEAILKVHFMPRKGDPIEVQWVDINVSGAKLKVPAEFVDELREGSPARLSFDVAGEPFRVNARVIWNHGSQDEDLVEIGVTFAYLNPEIGESHPELWEYFNRRKAYRVSPPRDEVLNVELVGDHGKLATRLLDISATGISIRLPKDAPEEDWIEQPLGHKFKLTFVLMEAHKPLEITARTERVFRKAGDSCWGLSILEEDERHFTDAIEEIADYVMACQRSKRGVDE